MAHICTCQNKPKWKWHVTKNYLGSTYDYYMLRIDTINGDTAIHYKSTHRYVEKSKEGVLLKEGHKMGGFGSACGCTPMPHGYWIERYRNGFIKEQGQYDCREKIGTWMYYYENGFPQKVVTYKRPYLEMFTKGESRIKNLKSKPLLDGPYLEYYENGQPKLVGHYNNKVGHKSLFRL